MPGSPLAMLQLGLGAFGRSAHWQMAAFHNLDPEAARPLSAPVVITLSLPWDWVGDGKLSGCFRTLMGFVVKLTAGIHAGNRVG
jgi:hypothetical protein